MKIAIIEDEQLTAEDLSAYILQFRPGAEIVKVLASVAEAKKFFASHPSIDLLFSDIQLGDGVCFDIFTAYPPQVPVIFCTAYHEYALEAFRTNGIAYLLKPFSAEQVREALDKRDKLSAPTLSQLSALLPASAETKRKALLVSHKDRIIPIRLEEVALFYIRNELTHVLTFEGKDFPISQTLEEIEKMADESFFRAGRQHLVSRKAVKDASHYFGRKLLLNLNVSFADAITVSKEKAPVFLEWLVR